MAFFRVLQEPLEVYFMKTGTLSLNFACRVGKVLLLPTLPHYKSLSLHEETFAVNQKLELLATS
jgi:hypothetical protein